MNVRGQFVLFMIQLQLYTVSDPVQPWCSFQALYEEVILVNSNSQPYAI